jgi:hypothetical protein
MLNRSVTFFPTNMPKMLRIKALCPAFDTSRRRGRSGFVGPVERRRQEYRSGGCLREGCRTTV